MKRLVSLVRQLGRRWGDWRGLVHQRAAQRKADRALHEAKTRDLAEKAKKLRALAITNASPSVRLGQVRQQRNGRQ